MKRTRIFLVPPLVFALAALLTWLAGTPAAPPAASENPTARSPRTRAATAVDSLSLAGALLDLERNILPHNPAPPRKEPHDAKGMDEALRSDETTRWFPGGGLAAVIYASEWAEEAPEVMFAWLVQKTDDQACPAWLLFDEWASKDMEAALAAVERIPVPKTKSQALMTTLEMLATRDPGRARELLLRNLGLLAADGAIPDSYGSETAETTLALLQSLPSGRERTRLLANFLTNHSNDNTARAAWKQASDSERREWLDAGFSPPGSADDYNGLGDLMRERAESSGDPAAVSEFLEHHGRAWARRDLAGALEWALPRLKGKLRVECQQSFFRAAADEDPETARRVLREMPPGHIKERLERIIQRTEEANPK